MTERPFDHRAVLPAKSAGRRDDPLRPQYDRGILIGRAPRAYTTLEASAHSVARAGNPNAVLLATLGIVREVLARHAPDFSGRVHIIALVDSAIQFGQSNRR